MQVSPPTPDLAEACEHAAALAWQAGERTTTLQLFPASARTLWLARPRSGLA